jgi:hypothetical protein
VTTETEAHDTGWYCHLCADGRDASIAHEHSAAIDNTTGRGDNANICQRIVDARRRQILRRKARKTRRSYKHRRHKKRSCHLHSLKPGGCRFTTGHA